MTSGSSDLPFGQVATLLRRRWKLVATLAVVGVASAGSLGILLPPFYSAKVQLIYETEVREGAEADDDTAIETLAQLMVSPGHLRRIEASLAEDAVADGTVEGGDGTATPDQPAATPTFEELERRLNAYKERGSRLISVTFSSEDPEEAAAVAKRAVELYFQLATEWRSRGRENALATVSAGIAAARAELDRAETELRSVRREYGAALFDGADQIDIQIADLNRQRNITQSVLDRNRHALEARTGARGTGRVDGEATRVLVGSSVVVDPLQGGFAALGDLDEIDLANPPLDEEQQRLTLEIDADESQLREIDERLQTLRRAGQETDEGLAAVQDLRRQVETNSHIYQALLQRQADLMGQSVDRLPVRIVSTASIPTSPSSPHPLIFVLPALVASGLIGGTLAIALEKMDKRLRSERDIEDALGLPCIGLVPKVPRRRGVTPQNILQAQPFAPYTEAIRSTVVAALHSSGAAREPRSFLITSSADGDGKTTLALSFASYAARLGRRVILVDLDLRHPGLLKAMGAPSDSSTRFLDGDVVANTRSARKHGIDYLALPPEEIVDPLELLTGQRVETLLSTLRRTYDCIVIDSAPAGTATETRIIATAVDRVVLAVRWGVTEAQSARTAVQQLRAAVPGKIEVVITQVDLRRHKRYRYGEPGPTLHAPFGAAG